MRLLLLLTAFTWACSPSDSGPDDAGDEDAPLDTEEEEAPPLPGFEPDLEPENEALYLDVDMTDPTAPVATVWAARLGPVFGIALHLTLDPTHITAHDPVSSECLGTDSAGEAEYLAVAHPDDVALGATRRGPDAGEVDISAPTLVATIPLTVVTDATSRIEITAFQVRRADGTVTPVDMAGGTLTTGGAP